MDFDMVHERVLHPVSTRELERRSQATREIMKEEKIDFLLIQNSNDYLGGYVKRFTAVPVVHHYPALAVRAINCESSFDSPLTPRRSPWTC